MKTLAYIVAGVIIIFALADGLRANFPDTYVFWKASRGEFISQLVRQPDKSECLMAWLYAPGEEHLWFWMVPVKYDFAKVAWFVLSAGGFLFIVHKLNEATPYAPIILAAVSFPLAWQLSGANAQILLLALALNPLGAALACAVKPHFALAVLFHIWHLRGTVAPHPELSPWEHRIHAVYLAVRHYLLADPASPGPGHRPGNHHFARDMARARVLDNREVPSGDVLRHG